MPEIDGPELHVITFSAGAGEEFGAQAERHRAEARSRYLAYLSQQLGESGAAIALDALTVWNDVTSGDRCACSCHPRLADGDLHDYGFGCRSPEGELITAEREAEKRELAAWLDRHPDIVVTSYGGMFPEQWWGDVDNRSFYFRERNDTGGSSSTCDRPDNSPECGSAATSTIPPASSCVRSTPARS